MTSTSARPAYQPMSRFLPAPLRSLLRDPRIEPKIVAVLRSRMVHESPSFALRELSGRPVERIYRVRANGLRALVVHGSSDAAALDQAFYERAHEPPVGALEALRGLGRPPRALDLGANVGMWGLWLHGRFPGAHVTALEPDRDNVARHRRQIELNGLQESWEVIEAAAVSTEGPVSFAVGQSTTGRVLDGDEAGGAVVPGRDVFDLLKGIDLLKMDIEGSEWPILADPRVDDLSAPVVMVEYHAHGAPSADPERDARRALERAGYTTESTLDSAPGFGVVWGWKTPCESAST
jgi:FkbM family methyltransferase